MAWSDIGNSSAEALVRYRLLRETHHGGMSQIWEAVDTQTGRRVAIERLSVPMTLTPRERRAWVTQIEQTAKEITRLKHPNIAAIYDFGQDNGQPFLVMDLLPGRTLRQRLREGPLTSAEAAHLLTQAATALDAAHGIGLVHGGLKPANFRLLPNGTIKLMDFGVAHQGDSTGAQPTEKTPTGMMVESPSYLSPEQIQCGPISAASDVWALGVILYEMLVGQPPFSGSRMEDVLQQITTGSPPPVPRMPPSIQMVLSRALAKDPGQRYGQAGEMAAALRDALSPSLLSVMHTAVPRQFQQASVIKTPARSGPPTAPGIERRLLLTLVSISLLGLLFFSLRAYYSPASRPLPAVPNLPTEAVLPRPQPPPVPPADDASPFTAVPPPPVVLEPPGSAKKRHDDGKPEGQTRTASSQEPHNDK